MKWNKELDRAFILHNTNILNEKHSKDISVDFLTKYDICCLESNKSEGKVLF